MTITIHILEHDSWSGVKLLDKRTFKTKRGAEAFVKRHNARNNLPQVPEYYTKAYVVEVDGFRVDIGYSR